MTEGPSRARAAALLLVVLAGSLVVGRLSLDAWLSRADEEAVAAPDAPRPREAGASPPSFLLAILDGLRAESAASEAMPAWRRLAREGASGIASTGEPTLTTCCVRTLLTGRNPDLYTAFRNFDAKHVEGSVVQLAARAGSRAAHAGDASVFQQVGDAYRPEDVLALPDRGPADQGEGDDRAVPFALGRIADGADVVTLHLVRPDHAAHKHGASGPEYAAACAAVDRQVDAVVTAFRAKHPNGLVLLAADHGVTARGTHGGGEADARRAPFVLVGPGVARAAGVEVAQSALAPTMAVLLGLPPTPLAESAPAFELTTLSPERCADEMNAYLRARLAVARRAGASSVAEAIETRRAQVALARADSGGLATLGALSRQLEADAFSASRPAVALAALLLAALWIAAVVRAAAAVPEAGGVGRRERWPLAFGGAAVLAAFLPGSPWVAGALLVASIVALEAGTPRLAGAGAALASYASLPVLAGAGLLLQSAFDSPDGAAPAVRRLALVAGTAALAVAALSAATRVRERLVAALERHPGLVAAAAGLLFGFALSLRPFVDPVLAGAGAAAARGLPTVYALAGIAAAFALAASSRAKERAPRLRWAVPVVALVLFGGAHAFETALGSDAMLSSAATGLPWTLATAACATVLALDARRAASRAGDAVLVGLAVLAAAAAFSWRAAGRDAPVAWSAATVLSLATVVASLALGGDRVRLSARLLAVVALGVVLHERSDAQALAYALLALGARASGEFAAPRTRLGLAALAVAILAARVAAFHALGFYESLSTIDTGVLFPASSGAGGSAASGTGTSPEIVVNAALQVVRFALPWLVLLAAARHVFAREGRGASFRRLATDLATAYAARSAAIVAGMWVWWRSSWWVRSAHPVFVLGVADAVLLALAAAATGAFRGDPAPAPAVAPAA